MNVTKKMIDDLFNVITATLDAFAIVDPNATSLTTKELAVDVLTKTMDSLKADIELYFLQSDPATSKMTVKTSDEIIAKAKSIAASTNTSGGDSFEKIWSVTGAILNLIVDAAKANLPAGSTALDAMITGLDAILALGNQLKVDLPKLNQK